MADILRSDDLSIYRNAEQANALLDLYEQGKGKEDIQRDATGREMDEVKLRPVVRFAAWIDEQLNR